MKLTLKIWRQDATDSAGGFVEYPLEEVGPEFSLLEALDKLNDELVADGREPVAFDSDCREGVCGSCGITVDGRPHGPVANTPSCRQHLRSFDDGATVRLEPFRSAHYPVVKDLVVDRDGLDRIIGAGGYVSVDAGTAPDADSHPVTHEQAEYASTWPPASAAGPASRPARTVRRICSPAPSCCTCRPPARPGPSAAPGPGRWPRRARSSVPVRCTANASRSARRGSR